MAIETKNPKLAEAGRRGGLAGGSKGGHNRMAQLTPEERSDLARQAAAARWADPIQDEVIRKAKQMLAQIAVDGKPQYFYFDGERAWHAVVGYDPKKRWDAYIMRTCTTETTLTEIVEDAMNRRST